MTTPYLPLSLSREQMIEYTPEWEGRRADDGRPFVSDDIIERMKQVTITEAWMTMYYRDEYHFQYEDGWERVRPDTILCGRALTAMFMPRRKSLHAVVEARARAAGQVGDQVSWPIYALNEGDVYVADVFGKVDRGPIIGDNLGTAIYRRSKRGTVQNAAIRDLDGLQEIEGFTAFTRGAHPSFASPTVTIVGINCPVRIGKVMVFPGDVVLGKQDGLIFIPPHLAERVVITSEIIRVRDIFGKQRLNEGKYLPGEIDGKWTETIELDFRRWLKDSGTQLPIPAETIASYLGPRSW